MAVRRSELVAIVCMLIALAAALGPSPAQAQEPGTDEQGLGPSEVTFGSILPVVTESGYISLSVDGLGVYPSSSGTVDVEKPAGATVRAAYLAAASTGFHSYNIAPSEITIDGVAIGSWVYSTSSSIYSWNHWADVTALVKPKVDAAPAGRVAFTISEGSTYDIEGHVLAVILNDPNQITTNTVVLLFGAQNVEGDTFNIALADPINAADPNLILDMALGISYGYQPSSQYSRVDVNGQRLTSAAGGQDDGETNNGALMTVGGLDDSNDNPADPYAGPTSPRSDDELYDLLPFVTTGDTAISVFTVNPSDDDNIFFASLFLTGEAIVGEGIILSPNAATNPLGEEHTLTATLQDDNGEPIVDRDVTFDVLSGPNAGLSFTFATNADGKALFNYTSSVEGVDTIQASFVNSRGQVTTSAQATKSWVEGGPQVVGGFGAGTVGAAREEHRLVERVTSDPDLIRLAFAAAALLTLAAVRSPAR